MGDLESSKSYRQIVGQWLPGLGPGARGPGDVGGFCTVGAESQFGKMTKFCRRAVGWLHSSVNVLHAAELKMVKMVNFVMYVYHNF